MKNLIVVVTMLGIMASIISSANAQTIYKYKENELNFMDKGRKRRELFKNNPERIFAPGYISLMTSWLKDLSFDW